MNNINITKRHIKTGFIAFLIALAVSIFVIFPIYKTISTPEFITFTVIEKISKIGSNQISRHESEIVEKIYVRIRYENGDEETLTFTDPFVSRTYDVGTVYKKEYVEISFSKIISDMIIIMECVILIFIFVGFCISICVWIFDSKTENYIEFLKYEFFKMKTDDTGHR